MSPAGGAGSEQGYGCRDTAPAPPLRQGREAQVQGRGGQGRGKAGPGCGGGGAGTVRGGEREEKEQVFVEGDSLAC